MTHPQPRIILPISTKLSSAELAWWMRWKIFFLFAMATTAANISIIGDQISNDNSDNKHESSRKLLNCTTDDMFLCEDKLKCVPLKWKCDFSPDCLDGSDEPPDCPISSCQPSSSRFECTFSKKCIPSNWVCDNEVDCGSDPLSGRNDDSDEDPALCKRHGLSCGPNQLMCKDNMTCLETKRFCDHHVDCPDNSDEGPFCKQAPSCIKLGCEHACSVTWRGPRCYCESGSQPDPSNKMQCIDQDECLVSEKISRFSLIVAI